MRRHQEAEKLIRLGCRLNGIILPSDFKLDKVEHEDGEGSDDEATGEFQTAEKCDVEEWLYVFLRRDFNINFVNNLDGGRVPKA